jgi:hypothetical protein
VIGPGASVLQILVRISPGHDLVRKHTPTVQTSYTMFRIDKAMAIVVANHYARKEKIGGLCRPGL